MAGRGPSPQSIKKRRAAMQAVPGGREPAVPRCPRGLKAAGKALWREMTDDLVLDARELSTLHRACLLADNAAEVQALVDREGLMIPGSTGQMRIHPGLAEVRQTQGQIGRLLALLKPPEGSAASMRAKHAARRRWAV